MKWNFENLKKHVETKSESKLLSFERTSKNINMKLKCKCENEFERTLSNFNKDNFYCKECTSNIVDCNLDKIKEYIIENNLKIKVLSGVYESYTSIMEFECECGHPFKTTWSTVLNQGKTKCDDCVKIIKINKTTKWTDEALKELVENNSNCIYLSFRKEIIKGKTRVFVKMKCDCGNEFEKQIESIQRNIKTNILQCQKCNRQNANKDRIATFEQVKLDFEKLGYKPLFNDYNKCTDKLDAETKEGYKIQVVYNALNIRQKDLYFSKNNKYTMENINLYLKLNEPSYKLLSDTYVSFEDNLTWECNNGHIFEMSIDVFTRGCRCPECINEESKLQEKVRLYLESKFENIKHEYCTNIKCINPNTNRILPYDNEIIELKLICEVNGKQHYEICTWHKKLAEQHNTTPQEEFEYQQWKDEYKKQYCLNKGYNYLEIPYWTDNKEEEYKILIDNKIKEITC